MAKDKDAIYTGIIEKDENGNYFSGPYLLDYRMVAEKFKEGDRITIRSVIENPSDKSYDTYNKKSKDFVAADKKKFVAPQPPKGE
ncbi:hypothetical protein AM493_12275 [Flavobacterium akiainvivens]|uniref:DUF3127 domain-containing protein n=2 Tax=Flavobacterium akiainvivens TaxID=1202724 RepID=A0A0M8MLN1_9FLAO|nr:hypothetical protein [Flavobacterium akiainvivens]KOS08337.1 hypothetical protein AM493_12275 [Flavobacterium akiainvivens]